MAKKNSLRNQKDLEVVLMHEAISHYNFADLEAKRVLVKGCAEEDIPENVYIELVEKLKTNCKIAHVR